MNSTSAAPLKSLVQTLNDSIEFYRMAAQKAEHESYRQAFKEMGETHVLAKSYLQPYLIMQTGVAEEGHTFGSKLHHRYVEMQDAANNDHDQNLLKQLSEVEDITLNMMEVTAVVSKNAMVRMVIKGLMPQMNKCRERVLSLANIECIAC